MASIRCHLIAPDWPAVRRADRQGTREYISVDALSSVLRTSSRVGPGFGIDGEVRELRAQAGATKSTKARSFGAEIRASGITMWTGNGAYSCGLTTNRAVIGAVRGIIEPPVGGNLHVSAGLRKRDNPLLRKVAVHVDMRMLGEIGRRGDDNLADFADPHGYIDESRGPALAARGSRLFVFQQACSLLLQDKAKDRRNVQ